MVGVTADAIRAYIKQGRFQSGDFLESENNLAEMLAVSRGTVRQAISLLVATGELTRLPHSRPRIEQPKDRGETSKALDVCVWVSHPISDNASLMFMKGVSLGLKGTPYRMIVREPTRFVGEYVRSDERQFLTDVLESPSAAGAIVQRDACAKIEDLVVGLQRAGKALVFVDTMPPKDLSADYVGSANLASARQCVEHLIKLGHKRIACLVESDISETTQQRINGYWRAMRHAGLEPSGRCLVGGHLPTPATRLQPAGRFETRYAKDGAYYDWSQRLVFKLLSLPERPTAVFCGCDVLAHSVAALLEGAGLKIPDDVSVVGFDWLARWEHPQLDDLTTASQDFEGFGRHAVDLLLDRLESPGGASARHILLSAPLVIRSSSAPTKVQEPISSPNGGANLVSL